MSGPLLLVLRIALAVVLYIFLGWAFYTIWQELQRQSKWVSTSQAPLLTLILESGDEPHTYRFTNPDLLVGRDLACSLHLDDKTISAQHARMSFHHNQWWVEDLHSTNGTCVNLEPVASPLVLTSGDQIRFGQVAFRIMIGEKAQREIENSL